jgi:hypothetical protein
MVTESLGNKYKINRSSTGIIRDSYEYYVHANFEIEAFTTLTINSGGQLCLGDGFIKNNGTLLNNGTIIDSI